MSGKYSVVPHPKLKRDYAGRMVRTTRELKNGWVIIPAGTVAGITYQPPKGSTLAGNPCNCCGVRPIISHAGMDDIEFIEPAAGGGES